MAFHLPELGGKDEDRVRERERKGKSQRMIKKMIKKNICQSKIMKVTIFNSFKSNNLFILT